VKTRTYLGVWVDFEGVPLGVECGDFGDVLILALTLLLLKFEGDTVYRTLLNTLHQVGGEASDLVAQAF
jgi:hypothetical protein